MAEPTSSLDLEAWRSKVVKVILLHKFEVEIVVYHIPGQVGHM